jgi:hypothetical protein
MLIIYSGPGKIMISAAMTPAEGTDEELDAWYRELHCKALPSCPGYTRTKRYNLVFNRQNRLPPSEMKLDKPAKYLALHEFETDTIPEQFYLAVKESWVQKFPGGVQKFDAHQFVLLKNFEATDS